MPDCDYCYDPNCARSLNAAAECNCSDFFRVVREVNNTYSNGLYTALPASAAAITPSHIDALRGFTSAALQVLPLEPGDTALFNGGNPVGGNPWEMQIDGTNLDHLSRVLPIFKHNPDHRARIIDRLERLSLNAANTGQRDACARVMKRCEDFVRDLQTQTLTKAASADDFENRKHPLARLYFIIVKAQASGPLTMAKSGLTSGRMDKETGTPLMTFEKLKEVRSMNDLHLIWNDFQKAVYVVGRNGGRSAWTPFWNTVYALCVSRPEPTYMHELFFEAMTFIDLNPGVNIKTFMTQHWTTFLIVFEAKWRENGEPGNAGSDLSGGGDHQHGRYREHVKFGEVTKQGEWAGEMRTRSGAIAFCNKWSTRKDCTAGVLKGAHQGKCAYTHKCRFCMRTDHRPDDKKPDGSWTCAKHP